MSASLSPPVHLCPPNQGLTLMGGASSSPSGSSSQTTKKENDESFHWLEEEEGGGNSPSGLEGEAAGRSRQPWRPSHIVEEEDGSNPRDKPSQPRFRSGDWVPVLRGDPDWLPDELFEECSNNGCTKSFSLATRRHHCRGCGKVFCASCSSKTYQRVEGEKPLRVCDACHSTLEWAAIRSGKLKLKIGV